MQEKGGGEFIDKDLEEYIPPPLTTNTYHISSTSMYENSSRSKEEEGEMKEDNECMIIKINDLVFIRPIENKTKHSFPIRVKSYVGDSYGDLENRIRESIHILDMKIGYVYFLCFIY